MEELSTLLEQTLKAIEDARTTPDGKGQINDRQAMILRLLQSKATVTDTEIAALLEWSDEVKSALTMVRDFMRNRLEVSFTEVGELRFTYRLAPVG